MTAPTMITVSGSFYDVGGNAAAGSCTFTPVNEEMNNGNLIDLKPIVVSLASGVLSTQLAKLDAEGNGYQCLRKLTGAPDRQFTFAATADIDISSL